MSSRACCCCPARCSRTLLQCGSRDCRQRSVGTVAIKLVRAVGQHGAGDAGPVAADLGLADSQLSGRPDLQKAGAVVHRHNPRQHGPSYRCSGGYGQAGLCVSVEHAIANAEVEVATGGSVGENSKDIAIGDKPVDGAFERGRRGNLIPAPEAPVPLSNTVVRVTTKLAAVLG
jgi:hypothetical protein